MVISPDDFQLEKSITGLPIIVSDHRHRAKPDVQKVVHRNHFNALDPGREKFIHRQNVENTILYYGIKPFVHSMI